MVVGPKQSNCKNGCTMWDMFERSTPAHWTDDTIPITWTALAKTGDRSIFPERYDLPPSRWLLFKVYIEIEKISSTTAKCVIQALKAIFSRHGVPETLISNNGPQFASAEFASFAADYDFINITSSPYFSQSNGEAKKRAVKTIKTLLKKNPDPYPALLTYRVTPLLHGPSPT